MKVGWSQFAESQRKPSALTPCPLASQLVHEHKDNLDVDAAVGILHKLDSKFVHLWVSCRGSHRLRRQSRDWSKQSISIKSSLIATINKKEGHKQIYCVLFLKWGSRKARNAFPEMNRVHVLQRLSGGSVYAIWSIALAARNVLLYTYYGAIDFIWSKISDWLGDACKVSSAANVKHILGFLKCGFFLFVCFFLYKNSEMRRILLKLSLHMLACSTEINLQLAYCSFSFSPSSNKEKILIFYASTPMKE